MEQKKRILHGNNARVDPGTELHSPLEVLIPQQGEDDKTLDDSKDGRKR